MLCPAKRSYIALVMVMLNTVVTVYLVRLTCRSRSQCTEDTGENVTSLKVELMKVSSQLATKEEQNRKLINVIRSPGLYNIKYVKELMYDGPTEEYEKVRRRIYSNTRELWFYINNELGKAVANDDLKPERIQATLDEVSERNSALLSDQEKLAEVDGYQEWRRKEEAQLSDLVQRRLHYLQNPRNCRNARKLICSLGERCGFTYHLHHLIYCLLAAYESERTLILDSTGWIYNKNGWSHLFQPLSKSCTTVYKDKIVNMDVWPVSSKIKVVSIPSLYLLKNVPKFIPLAIPADLAHRITKFHGEPGAWWVSQMLKFILKPRAHIKKTIDDTIAQNKKLRSPIVGLHIRRTDKVGSESTYHHIDEYMAHVAQFYTKLELKRKVAERRVYVATDDENVLSVARRKYPQYKFYSDPFITEVAATHRRYTTLSLTGLLVDLYMLAKCDFLVCTFSSNVGRAAYEIMLMNRMNASDSYFSLDYLYNMGTLFEHDRYAVMNSNNKHRDDYKVGDLLRGVNPYWNGSGVGYNLRTGYYGLFPWYKTESRPVLHPFPIYKEVPFYPGTVG